MASSATSSLHGNNIPTGKSPNSLEFVVEDQTVEATRMKDGRLETGGYVALSISSDQATSAKGVFTDFKGGNVPAHKNVNLSLYLSFGYGLKIETATLDDFSTKFYYFSSIVSDPTHTYDSTGGCMIMDNVPERVKSGNATYWMPGTDGGSDREMQPGNLLIQFDEWKDGVLTGRCLDPACPSGSYWGGGTCDVTVFFRIRPVEEDWYLRELQAQRDAQREGYQKVSRLLRECSAKSGSRN